MHKAGESRPCDCSLSVCKRWLRLVEPEAVVRTGCRAWRRPVGLEVAHRGPGQGVGGCRSGCNQAVDRLGKHALELLRVRLLLVDVLLQARLLDDGIDSRVTGLV